jgi:hypothetical protein
MSVSKVFGGKKNDVHMFDEFVCSTDVSHAGKANLRNDRSKLAASRTDAMCRGTVTCWEGLSRNNERGNIWPEVLEEVGQAVEEHKILGISVGLGQSIIAKA